MSTRNILKGIHINFINLLVYSFIFLRHSHHSLFYFIFFVDSLLIVYLLSIYLFIHLFYSPQYSFYLQNKIINIILYEKTSLI